MSVQQLNCGTMITGESINRFRLLMAIQGLETHIRSGGRMRVSRGVTPKLCMGIVSGFTRKKYKRTDAQKAVEDGRNFLALNGL
jgi:hypothetical protein